MRKTRTPNQNHTQAEPWRRENPNSIGKHKHLSAAAKAAAKHRAEAAGRRYPNLVDNMWAAQHDKS
jgi:hypothetical protein